MIERRQNWLQCVFAIAMFGLGCEWSNAIAAPPNPTVQTTVYPTGSFPLDAQNVQAAIDRGGTVLLKATDVTGHPTAFNFGAPDPAHGGTTCFLDGVSVSLTTDVTILGERDGQLMATIRGGCTPVLGQIPVKTKIEGIDFEAPVASAITLLASTGTEIVGNRINGVIGVLLTFGFTDGDGIDLFGNNDPQNAITGQVRIADNVIENLGADFANGMQLDEVSAEVEISGNTVNFPQSNGFIQTVGITAFRSHNRVSIVGNEVTMGPGSLDAFPAPIFISGEQEAQYLVAGNSVVSDHHNADGIIATGGDFSEPTQGAVIVGNHIVIHSSVAGLGGAGVSLYGGINNSLVSGNVIEGTSAFALQVAEGFLSSSTADHNRLLGNVISAHTAATADIYLGTNTSNTFVAGRCKTYIDLGVDNQVACGTAIGLAAPAARIADPVRRSPGMPRPDVRSAMVDALRGRLNR